MTFINISETVKAVKTGLLAITVISCSALYAGQVMAFDEKVKDYKKLLGSFTAPDGSKHSYDAFLKYFKVSGMSFVVVDNYQVVFSHSAGEKAFGTKQYIDKDTAFSTASVSKPITATIAAMLVEQGKLDLDAPISRYLKRWKMPASPLTKNSPITMRQLLSHTAGMSQGGYADFHLGDDIPTPLDTLNGLKLPRYKKPIEVMFAPNSQWEYSGGGYVIVQIALEDITGQPLQKLAQDMLFTPLGMNNTTMYQHGHPKFLTNVAKVHNAKQEVIRDGIPICPQIAPSGMWSTPQDMAIFTIEMQRALAGEKTAVISPKVAHITTHIETLDRVGGWGAGWMRLEGNGNIDWFSHGGSNTGTGGQVMASMKDGKGIMVFINANTAQRAPAVNALIKQIVNSLSWHQPRQAISESSIADRKSIIGRYISPFDQVVTIEQRGEKLIYSNPSSMSGGRYESEMYYQGEGEFALNERVNTVGVKINPVDKQFYLMKYRGQENLESFAMRKLGDNEKMPFEIALNAELKETLIAYKAWRQQKPKSRFLTANALNRAGYSALRQKNIKGAINLFSVYTAFYPTDANAYDSLGEAVKASGDFKESIKWYKKSLALNPSNAQAQKMIKEMSDKI